MKVVILAGGLGTRLKPFTDVIPKPLLPLGEKSLMEVQIEQLKINGFDEIYVALNHKADYIKSYFGDGSKFGVKVNYSLEKKPLGTCGPISLLRDFLTEPFLLMNGDILTKAHFKEIYERALSFEDSLLTLVTKNITTPFRFGNIISDGVYVKGVDEKPDLQFEILSGIYILKPGIFDLIPKDEYFGIDQLIKNMLDQNLPVTRYLLKEYWIDIGMVEDYEKAREFYDEHFTV
jgi:NDP-sugar pyrophosphorylase family protein